MGPLGKLVLLCSPPKTTRQEMSANGAKLHTTKSGQAIPTTTCRLGGSAQLPHDWPSPAVFPRAVQGFLSRCLRCRASQQRPEDNGCDGGSRRATCCKLPCKCLVAALWPTPGSVSTHFRLRSRRISIFHSDIQDVGLGPPSRLRRTCNALPGLPATKQ